MRKLLMALATSVLTTMSFAVEQKILVVTEEMPPYNFTDNKNNITGLATEIVQEIFKRADLAYEITSLPWSRAIRTALSNPDVAIYSIGRNEERELRFKWVGAIASREVWLYKLKSRHDIRIKELPDLALYVIGGIRDGLRTQYLLKEGFTVDLVTDDINNLRKLLAGRIDLLPIDEANLRHLAERNGIDFTSMERVFRLDKLTGVLNLAYGLKTPDATVEKCRHALAGMVADGTVRKITAQWQFRLAQQPQKQERQAAPLIRFSEQLKTTPIRFSE